MIILQVIIFLEVISKKQQSSTTLREKENEKNVSFSLFEIVLYRDQFGTPCVYVVLFSTRERREEGFFGRPAKTPSWCPRARRQSPLRSRMIWHSPIYRHLYMRNATRSKENETTLTLLSSLACFCREHQNARQKKCQNKKKQKKRMDKKKVKTNNNGQKKWCSNSKKKRPEGSRRFRTRVERQKEQKRPEEQIFLTLRTACPFPQRDSFEKKKR